VKQTSKGSGWRNPRFGPSLGGTLLVFLLVAASAACEARQAWGGPKGENRRIVVTPFRADSSRRESQGRAVAESLAARLDGVQGLQARVAAGEETAGADFVVRGEIGSRDGRLVIATRLHHVGVTEQIWTATFWRKDSLDSELVGELASGLAEAIYGQLAREAITKRGKP